MKRIITADKANKPYGFAQLDANSNIPGNVVATTAVSASYALTASYALNGGGGGTAIDTGSLATTGSNNFVGTQIISGSIKFGDNTQQITITGADADQNYPNSQRIVLQGTQGYGSYGEGGDIYLWAGAGSTDQGSGGDIKVRGGYGYDNQGGYVKIQGGNSSGQGGYILVEGGYGNGGNSGGDITIRTQYGTPSGKIYIQTPSNQLVIDDDAASFVSNKAVNITGSLNIAGSTILSGSTTILAPVPQNFPTASVGDVPGMVAFDKDYIYYCAQEFSTAGIVTHVYDEWGTIPWNGYHDPGTSWLQTGPSQEGGGGIPPSAGWYFIDDTSTIRQLTSDNVWFGGQGPAPQQNGAGWICSVDSNDWVYSDSNPTLTFYETNPNQIIWKRTPWNAITNQITGSVEITGSLNVIGTTNIRPYRIYTALLNQQGGDNPDGGVNFELTIGRTYTIIVANDGDFTNVGAPNNEMGTSFSATGTTPNSWGTAQLAFNTGAPVATVLENTLGVNVWWEYRGSGNYRMHVEGEDLTKAYISNYSYYSVDTELTYLVSASPSNIVVGSVDFLSRNITDGTSDNDVLINTPIEVRVYN